MAENAEREIVFLFSSLRVFLCALCGLKKLSAKVFAKLAKKDCLKNLEGFARSYNYKNTIKPSRFIACCLLSKEPLYKCATPMKLINDIMSGSKKIKIKKQKVKNLVEFSGFY